MKAFAKLLAALLLLIGTIGCNPKDDSRPYVSISVVTDLLKKVNNQSIPIEKRIEYGLEADSVAIQLDDKHNHLTCMRLLGTLYLKQGNKDRAKEYFLQTTKLGQTTSNSESVAIALSNIGYVYNDNSDYDSAILYYSEANRLFRTLNQAKPIAQNLINIAVAYKNLGNFQTALMNNFEAIRLLDSLGAQKDLAYGYISVGNNLKEIGRLNEALEFHKKAFAIMQTEDDSPGMAIASNNLGNVYKLKKEFKNALSHYLLSLKIKQKHHSIKAVAITLNNIGNIYSELKEWDNAQTYLRKSLKIRDSLNDKDGILTTSNDLAKVYLQIGKIGDAERIAENAYMVSMRTHILNQKLENNTILSEVYKAQDQYKKALNHLQKALELKDSLFNSDMAKAMSEMQTKYKTEQKEAELKLTRQKAASDAALSNFKMRLWGSIGALSVVIGLISFYYYRRRQRYLFKQRLLDVKQEALTAQLDTHFISDTIDTINSFVEANDRDTASDYLLKFSRLIRIVLGNSFRKLVPLQDDLAAMFDYFNLAKLRFPDGHVTLKVVIYESLDLESTLIPPMILQVLVGNALKHAFTNQVGGTILVDIYPHEKSLRCVVSDNGIGRTAAGKVEETANTRVSYGSDLAKKLLRIWSDMEGRTEFEIIDLKDENGVSKGTQCKFSFPLISNK